MYFADVIYLYLKEILIVLIKTKHNDNMTTNGGKMNLNMRKKDTFQQISCFCDIDLDLKYIIYEIYPYVLKAS